MPEKQESKLRQLAEFFRGQAIARGWIPSEITPTYNLDDSEMYVIKCSRPGKEYKIIIVDRDS